MSCTFLHMTRGSFTDIPLWRGPGGIRIRGYGLVARISRLESGSPSVGSEVLAGDGVIGVSTGITITQGLTAAGITPAAEPFTTGAVSPEERPGVGELPADPVRRPGLSRETGRRLVDMLRHAVRAGYARAPSVATAMAGRLGATPHVEAAAWVAADFMEAADLTGAAVGAGNQS